MSKLESLNDNLTQAAKLIDGCSSTIKDSPLEPNKEYIYKIGEILSEIFEIQHAIYDISPALTPEHLREEPDNSPGNIALNYAYKEAMKYEDSGDIESAIDVFKEFIESKYPVHYSDIAKSEIERLRGLNT